MNRITFSSKFKVGDQVKHVTKHSPEGRVANLIYDQRVDTITVVVAWRFDQEVSHFEEELIKIK